MQAHTNGDTTSINTSSSSSVGSVTGTAEESHECYVFISNKLASDITLTIGQAFDLAYRRYMTDSGKQFEISKLQSHNKILEGTVQTYRERLREVAEILSKADLDKLLLRLGVRDICEVQVETGTIDGNKTPDLGEFWGINGEISEKRSWEIPADFMHNLQRKFSAIIMELT